LTTDGLLQSKYENLGQPRSTRVGFAGAAQNGKGRVKARSKARQSQHGQWGNVHGECAIGKRTHESRAICVMLENRPALEATYKYRNGAKVLCG
jgi:hypothetical protein